MARGYLTPRGAVTESSTRSYLSTDGAVSESGGATTEVSSDLAVSYSVQALVNSNLSASYSIESAVTFVSSDLVAAYGISSLVSASVAATYDVAGPAASGSFVTDAWINNTGTPHGAVAVSYTWVSLGRIGSLTAKTLTEGTGMLSSGSILTATGLPPGAGFMLGAVLGSNAGDDAVFYQAGTVT